jgi:hypothetical protein
MLPVLLVLVLAACSSGGPATPGGLPNIAGVYSGSYTVEGQPGTYNMQLQLTQAGSMLSGTTTDNGGAVYNDTGTIANDGTFTIAETYQGQLLSTLDGSIEGPGHVGGTWHNTGGLEGNWDVQS